MKAITKIYSKEEADKLTEDCEKDYAHFSGRVISSLAFIRWLYENGYTIQQTVKR